MDSGSKERSVSFWITVGAAILLAAFFLFFGISELLHPDVGKEFLAENTRVCITMIIMGLALLFGVFSPYWGGIVISICTVPFVIIFHFHPIFIAFGFLVLLVGIQFFLRGRRFRKLAKDEPQATL